MIVQLLLGKVITYLMLPVLLENVLALLTQNHLFSMPKTTGVFVDVEQSPIKLLMLLKLVV